MLVTYPIDEPVARLTLKAMQSLDGGILRQQLRWQVRRQGLSNATIWETQTPLPVFDLEPGAYDVAVYYQDQLYPVGTVDVRQGCVTDALFLLMVGGQYVAESGYFVMADAQAEYARRQADRLEQAKLGSFATPLKDPFRPPEGELGSSRYKSHPLLSRAAQFDGVEKTVSPEPSENVDANEKDLTLKKQLTPSYTFAPTAFQTTPVPRPGG